MSDSKRLSPFEGIKKFFYIISSGTYRFYWDDCFSRAASLAYTTLFSLFPVTAIGLSMFGLFGFDDEQLKETLRKIIEQLFPRAEDSELLKNLQEDVFSQLLTFSQNFADRATTLSTVSIGVLVVTSIALLNTIERALNVIWRVTSELTLFAKIISFWAVITLGPALIAVSIIWTTKFREVAEDSVQFGSGFLQLINVAVPIAVSAIALTLLYYKMPATKVRWKDAFFGGCIAAILFELVKEAFRFYVSMSTTTTYSAIYGALAGIPLFLLLLYLFWLVVLFGAEIAYQSGSIKILSGRRKYASSLGEIGAVLGLRILFSIGKRFLQAEEPPTEGEIVTETGMDPQLVRECLDLMTEARVLTVATEGAHSRTLLVPPSKLNVGRVLETFLSRRHRKRADRDDREQALFLEVIKQVSTTLPPERLVTEWTLKELIEASNTPA